MAAKATGTQACFVSGSAADLFHRSRLLTDIRCKTLGDVCCISTLNATESQCNAFKKSFIAANLPRQVPSVLGFRMTCEKRGTESDVCDVRATPLTCTSPIGSSVYGGRAGKKAALRSEHREVRRQPLQAALCKVGSLIGSHYLWNQNVR